MTKRLVYGLVAIPLLTASTAFGQTDAALIERGQKVFAAEKCSICHAVAGKGNAKGALDDVGTKWSKDDIQKWIVSAPEMAAKTKAVRKPPMKAYSYLSKADVDALVGYLSSLKKS